MPTETHEAELQRYWWLKRLSAAAAVLFVVLIVIWLLWYWHANKRMAQVITEFRAAGLPVSVEDLNRPAIPESRNGIPLLNQAISQISALDVPTSSTMNYRDGLPYPPAWHQMMEKAFPANAAVYPLVRQARLRGDADWQFQYSSPLPAWPAAMNGLASLRQLANVLGDTALYHHFKGNDQEAIATILDCQYLARAISTRGFLVPALVATGIDALATNRLQIIATELQIAPGAALRAEVMQVVADMSGNGPVGDWFSSALLDENVLILNSSRTRADLFVLTPLNRLQATNVVRAMRLGSIALHEPTLPAANARLGSLPRPETPPLSVSDQQYLWSLPRYTYRSMINRRAAAISLAAALYRNDRGEYPTSLDGLVPTYLLKVPVDPLSAGGKPFGYIMAAHGTRPVLISAGEDGIVQTIDESFLPSSVCYGWQDTKLNKCDDQYLDLSAWKDPTPPAEPETPAISDTPED